MDADPNAHTDPYVHGDQNAYAHIYAHLDTDLDAKPNVYGDAHNHAWRHAFDGVYLGVVSNPRTVRMGLLAMNEQRSVTRRAEDITFQTDIQKQLIEIHQLFEVHCVKEAVWTGQVESLYKLFVTGNGVPSFQERIRTLEAWVKTATYLMSTVTVILIGYGLARLWQVMFP